MGMTPEEIRKLHPDRIDASTARLHELEKMQHVCCLCGKTFTGIGYDPYPLHERVEDDKLCVCCRGCSNRVTAARHRNYVMD